MSRDKAVCCKEWSMTTLASEDFAGSGALSGNWTLSAFSGATAATRASDQLSCPIGTAAWMYWNAVSWPNDQMCRLTYVSGSTSADGGAGPAVRVVAGSGAYFLQAGNTDTRVYKWTSGGGFVQLGTTDTTTPVNNDVFEIWAIGTTITAKRNGAHICGSPFTDATLASGSAGFWYAPDTAVDLRDNWEGADSGGFAAAAPPAPPGSLNRKFSVGHRPRPFAPGIAR